MSAQFFGVYTLLMNTFIRQKAEETDRQADKQTMSTETYNMKEMTKNE